MADNIHTISMFCSNCGEQLEVSVDSESSFCPYCGAKNKTIKRNSASAKRTPNSAKSMDSQKSGPVNTAINDRILSLVENIEELDLEELYTVKEKLDKIKKNKLLSFNNNTKELLAGAYKSVNAEIFKQEEEQRLEKERKVAEKNAKKQKAKAEKSERKEKRKARTAAFIASHDNEYISINPATGKIVRSKKLNKILAFAMAVITVLVSLSIGITVYKANRYDWSSVVLGDIIPKPELPKGEIIVNSSKGLNMYLFKSSVEEFNEYIADCTAAGFSYDAEIESDFYKAFNKVGHELELWYNAYESEIELSLLAPVKYDEFLWPDSTYANLIPIPVSTVGTLLETEEYLEVRLGETTKDEYRRYIDACVEYGFSFDQEKTEKTFAAKNEDGYILKVDYISYNTVYIQVKDPEYPVSMSIACEENWFLNKYDIAVYIDGSYITYIPHGDQEKVDLQLNNGTHVLMIEGDEESEPSGEIEFTVNGETSLSFKATCYGSYVSIRNLASNDADSKKTEGLTESDIEGTSDEQESGSETENDPPAVIPSFSKELATRAAVVAMTNGYATDVFAADGNNYDSSKFHSYDDVSSFYMTVYEEGTWTGKDETTWHVEGLTLDIAGDDTYVKATLDVTFDGNNYIVSNVTCVVAQLKYLDSDDPSKICVDTMEPSDFNSFLTVAPELIEANRDEHIHTEESSTEQTQNKDTTRTNWIERQFSFWDGAHKELEKLIIKSLNDEKSYKHIETEYIDVYDEAMKDYVNGILKGAGYSQRVEIKDLFILTKFSAKNAFGGTIKYMAYGISSYAHDTTSLVDIE